MAEHSIHDLPCLDTEDIIPITIATKNHTDVKVPSRCDVEMLGTTVGNFVVAIATDQYQSMANSEK